MRVLTFEGTDEGKVVFATLYMAFLNGPPAQDREQNRLINKVTTKLDDISVDVSGVDTKGQKVNSRKLQDDGAVLRLEDAEFDLLKLSMDAFIKNVGREWNQRNEDAFAFLDACPVEKVEATKPAKAKK